MGSGRAAGRSAWRLPLFIGVALVVFAAGVLLVRTIPGSPQRPPATPSGTHGEASGGPPPERAECDAPGRKHVTRYAGRWTARINDPYPPPDVTYDLRRLHHVGYGSTTRYAITIANPGSRWTSSRECLLGGTVLSSVDPSRTWDDLERHYNGDAMDVGIRSDWAVVDGLRVDNTYDAIAAQGPRNVELIILNAHLSNIRDDCIENDDEPKSLTVKDSLLDGCFTGISERPDPERPLPDDGRATMLDGVLMHIKPQAYGTGCRYPEACVDGRAAFGLFKWSVAATPRVVIRNSVLRVDRHSAYGPSEMLFPPGTTAENSVLVWLGRGPYPAPVPPGMRVVTDVGVWEQARARWLCRHGEGSC